MRTQRLDRPTVPGTLSPAEAIKELATGAAHRFADWPNDHVPVVAAGVYSIWMGEHGETLVYVGMSGRSATEEKLTAARASNKASGLRTRLASHWAGRRSGDQFVVYVADRLVLPTLSRGELDRIATGELHVMDALCRTFIHQNLSYRFACVANGATAFAVEKLARAGGLGALPLLNPLKPDKQRES